MDETTPDSGTYSQRDAELEVMRNRLLEIGTGDIQPCCMTTIKCHVLHNPMMVCSGCKQIIKCFKDQGAFYNYVTFCKSRRRPIQLGVVEEYFTCAFRSYDISSR